VVRIPGTDKGSYTDQEGRFFIRIDSLAANSILLVKGYGHCDLEIPIEDFQSEAVIELQRVPLPSSAKLEADQPRISGLEPQTFISQENMILPPDSNYISLPEGKVVILDGVVQDTFPLLRKRDVLEMYPMESERALFRYGMRGIKGMYFVHREKLSEEDKAELVRNCLRLPAWDSTRPYLDSIRRTFALEKYARYLEMRDHFGASPAFYADMAAHFLQIGQVKSGLRILSNLAEFDLESPEVLRTLAFTLQINGHHEEAMAVFERILNEFPNEPQSWRDLALAYDQVKREQEAVDLFDEMLRKDWSSVSDLFEGIEQTALAELNAILSTSNVPLKTDHIDQRVVYSMPVPLRITVDWNRFDTDIDLYLVTPAGDTLELEDENATSFPGTDMVDGYGPEEILLLKANPGAYKLLVDYYDDAQYNEMGPTLLKITITQGFGASGAESRIYGFGLDGEVKSKEVARFRVR
jgi:tetratricopeptide (TPR) repeat protein